MLWGEVREVRIVTHLRQAAESLEVEPDAAELAGKTPEEIKDASDSRLGGAALLRQDIEKRSTDPAYLIKVRHVGGPDDPMRMASLRAQLTSSRHAARARARKALLDEGETVSEQAITARMTIDPQWPPELGKATVAILKAGLEGGDKEIERLYKLGGGELLFQAMVEVNAAQEVSAEMGEG